jgi:transposase
VNGYPNDGSLFLFINRRRDRIKILYWEAGGFALWYKRLESGSFETVSGNKGESVVTIDATELSMLLSGISLQSVKRRKRFVA